MLACGFELPSPNEFRVALLNVFRYHPASRSAPLAHFGYAELLRFAGEEAPAIAAERAITNYAAPNPVLCLARERLHPSACFLKLKAAATRLGPIRLVCSAPLLGLAPTAGGKTDTVEGGLGIHGRQLRCLRREVQAGGIWAATRSRPPDASASRHVAALAWRAKTTLGNVWVSLGSVVMSVVFGVARHHRPAAERGVARCTPGYGATAPQR